METRPSPEKITKIWRHNHLQKKLLKYADKTISRKSVLKSGDTTISKRKCAKIWRHDDVLNRLQKKK